MHDESTQLRDQASLSTQSGRAQRLRRYLFTPRLVIAIAFLASTVIWVMESNQAMPQAWISPAAVSKSDQTAPPSATVSEPPKIVATPPEILASPAQPKKEFAAKEADILGTWVLDDGIRRVIHNRPDGTATIEIKFSYLTSFRYGEKLKLDLKWTLEDNVLTHEILDGTPEAGKKALIADFGSKSYFKVLNIADGKMDLVDFDDPPENYLWVRPGETPSVSAN